MHEPQREQFTRLHAVPVRMRLGSYEATILGWGFMAPKPWRNQLHAHTFFEICYAFQGRGTFIMAGQELAVLAGEVFIAKPGEVHQIISDRQQPLGIYFWSYTLVPASVDPAAEAVDALLRDFIVSTTCISRRVPGMERTLLLLTEEAVRREPGHAAVTQGLTGKLILDTARAAVGGPRSGEAPPPSHQPAQEQLVASTRRYLEERLSESCSLAGLAAQAGVSERHLSRLFRRRCGQSPMAFLARRRVETAGQLLLGGMAIREVAKRVGYQDVRYFTTVFRRATGLPPARYRDQSGTRMVGVRIADLG